MISIKSLLTLYLCEIVPLEFISINSNYIFMRNKSSKEMEVYPKSLVVKLTPTNLKSKKEMTLQDYLVNWIKLFVLIYEKITS